MVASFPTTSRRLARRHRVVVRQTGFTLVEVLIALAVVAISLAAIVKVGVETGYSFTYLRDRAMASWVASN